MVVVQQNVPVLLAPQLVTLDSSLPQNFLKFSVSELGFDLLTDINENAINNNTKMDKIFDFI